MSMYTCSTGTGLSGLTCVFLSLQKSSQKADEYLREIKEQSMLGEAVRQCVEAAGHEYDTNTQKSLMRVRASV